MMIRSYKSADLAGVRRLYAKAFPVEDLMPVVEALLNGTADILSLVAVDDTGILGHVIFTFCRVDGHAQALALLAPLAVLPERQRQGIGSRLVQSGFEALRKADVGRVLVLGDPAYYRRFGFEAERSVRPPYPLPDEWRGAWQSRAISDEQQAPVGALVLPDAWLRPSLWSP